ncbi:MAG: polysaccharide pyruvyl transferase family protein [Victivallaceae bacterium]|nr:polysaccharide pyruvyl transferase family protein [Victivallaceae bacterium]
MEPVKLYYAKRHPNLGDAASPLLVERLSGRNVKHAHFRTAELYAVGSILGKIFPNTPRRFRRLFGNFTPVAHIWGSGFMFEPEEGVKPERRTSIAALRGELSRRALEKILGVEIEAALGDPGILFDSLLDTPPPKRHSVGIIPHYRENGRPEFAELNAKIPDSRIIDVMNADVRATLAAIAECEAVVSSSLHGLVAAAAFHIPAIHISPSGAIRGGEFKFNDFYSAFGVENPPDITLDEALSSPPGPAEIAARCPLDPAKIDAAKRRLIDAWPL